MDDAEATRAARDAQVQLQSAMIRSAIQVLVSAGMSAKDISKLCKNTVQSVTAANLPSTPSASGTRSSNKPRNTPRTPLPTSRLGRSASVINSDLGKEACSKEEELARLQRRVDEMPKPFSAFFTLTRLPPPDSHAAGPIETTSRKRDSSTITSTTTGPAKKMCTK